MDAYFIINCSDDDVIRIESAEFGFIPYRIPIPDAYTGHCDEVFEQLCTLSTEALNVKCNGIRQCTFIREVFNYNQCAPRQNDVIKVTYDCIHDGK